MTDLISKIAWARLETIEENCLCPEENYDTKGFECCGQCPNCGCQPVAQED